MGKDGGAGGAQRACVLMFMLSNCSPNPSEATHIGGHENKVLGGGQAARDLLSDLWQEWAWPEGLEAQGASRPALPFTALL